MTMTPTESRARVTGERVTVRELSKIAADIIADWSAAGNESHPAGRYAVPMLALKTVGTTRRRGIDDGRRIVRSFLAHATAWTEPVAEAIKQELTDMIRR